MWRWRVFLPATFLMLSVVACAVQASEPITPDLVLPPASTVELALVPTAATPESTTTPVPPTIAPTSTPNLLVAFTTPVAVFTRAALRLENKRDEAVAEATSYYVSLGPFAHAAYGMKGEGLAFLLGELALLEAPPELRSIKDALLVIYRLEVDAIAQHGECTYWSLRTPSYSSPSLECSEYAVRVLPKVTMENAQSYVQGNKVTQGGWAVAQSLRAKTYERWRGIAQAAGLDLRSTTYSRLK